MKQETKAACEIYEMSDLSEKDFSVAIINIFTELKESMIKIKEGMMTMSHQTKNISKEIKIIKIKTWKL